tara:strand:+ start:12570 stop:13553 length:984 start_codon:yes stop_codon:yes gene_type:complete
MRYIIILIMFISNSIIANTCKGHFANPITDVCWSCLFPLSIGQAKVVHSDKPDTSNPSSPICACGGDAPRIGLSIGFWEPIALVDVTHKPYCLVNLGGISLDLGASYKHGYQNSHQGNNSTSFYNVHWYKFPLMLWLNLLTSAACLETSEFDVAYLSELDPTWQDDELAFITNPEAILFANPIAQGSCAADAISASTGNLPISSLFWCAGAQGSMYPLSGRVQNHIGGVQASTLLTERLAYKLHRFPPLLEDSVPENGIRLCSQHRMTVIPKERYRYQMVNPIATTNSNGCRPFGATTATWESGHEYPVKGEDFGYLVWRKRNCCAL